MSSDVIKQAEEKIKSFDLKFQSLKDTTRTLSREFDTIDSKCQILNRQFNNQRSKQLIVSSSSSSSSPESNRSTDSSSYYESPIINQSSNSHGSLDSNEIIQDDNYNDDDNVEHYEPSNVYIDRSIDDCNEMIKLLLLEANRNNHTADIDSSNANAFVDLITTQ
jgi:hypothetical protein